MRLTATKEDYIRALYILDEETELKKIRAVDLAKSLGLAKSTISERLKELYAGKLVQEDADGSLTLTRQGNKIGSRLTFRHRIIEVFLYNVLKIDRKKLHEEAHKLEHAFSDEVIDRLAEHLGNPELCPHGKKIVYLSDPKSVS